MSGNSSEVSVSFSVRGEKMIFGIENIPKRIRKGNQIPYQVIDHDIVEEVDVCIIGSGAAGSVLANKIVNGFGGIEGKNVVLIEKGGYYDPEDFNQREDSMMPLLWKNSGLQFNTDLSLLIAQGECVGGSTTINDAVCFQTPQLIIKEWRNKYGVDIDDSTWNKAYEWVKNKISINRISENELKKNKNAMILKNACDSAGYLGAANERNCIECATCGNCHLGCHYETKQDMLNTCIYETINLDNSKKFRIYSNCDIRKINYEGDRATGVEGKFTQKGQERFSITVNAKVIILAAGSIASSSLLLSNNIATGKAGKGLAFHPSALLIGKFKEEIRASEGIPMAYACHEFSILNNISQGGYMLESIFTPIYQFSLQLPRKTLGQNQQGNLMNDFHNYAMAGVMVRDEPTGSITISDRGNPEIHYKLGDHEIDYLTDGLKKLAELYFNSKAEKIYTGHSQINQLNNLNDVNSLVNAIKNEHANGTLNMKLGSAHPQGGNKMGSDSSSCVVDKNCKVYGFENLFVCDASVFPTALGVNPQVTVMVLASITADNILRSWNNFENIEPPAYFGETCDIRRPMFCGLETLRLMFNQNESSGNIEKIINDPPASQRGWLFYPDSLIISNEFHWRGFIPDLQLPPSINLTQDSLNWWKDYAAGFWKEFHVTEDGIRGFLQIYSRPDEQIEIIPEEINHEIYGPVIKLNYPNLPVTIFDLIKIVDEDNLIGKVFVSLPLYPELEIGTFSMTNNYPVKFMDKFDHQNIFNLHSSNTSLDDNPGYWSLRMVQKHLLSPVIKVFNFEKNGNEEEKLTLLKKELIDDFSKLTSELNLKWENKISKINDNFMVGKLVSGPLKNNVSDKKEYLENFFEDGSEKKKYVIRYSLATVAGEWFRE